MEVPDESETSLLNSGQPWSPAAAQAQADPRPRSQAQAPRAGGRSPRTYRVYFNYLPTLATVKKTRNVSHFVNPIT